MRTFCLTLVLTVALGASINASPEDPTDARVSIALQVLQRFDTSRSLDDLKASVSELTSAIDMSRIRPEDYAARRRSVVAAWALVLRRIEMSYDPNFDPADRANLPSTCVSPPREASGRQAMSCADPKDVEDPGARAVYIKELELNDRKTRRMANYQKIHNIDEAAMQSLRITLDLFRAKATSDSAALDVILRQAGISDARRVKIELML